MAELSKTGRQLPSTAYKPGKSGNPGGFTKERYKTMAQFRALLLQNGNLQEAYEILMSLMHSPNEKTAFAALKEYLDRALGRSPLTTPLDDEARNNIIIVTQDDVQGVVKRLVLRRAASLLQENTTEDEDNE